MILVRTLLSAAETIQGKNGKTSNRGKMSSASLAQSNRGNCVNRLGLRSIMIRASKSWNNYHLWLMYFTGRPHVLLYLERISYRQWTRLGSDSSTYPLALVDALKIIPRNMWYFVVLVFWKSYMLISFLRSIAFVFISCFRSLSE